MTTGGNPKQPGIVRGKANFHMNGKNVVGARTEFHKEICWIVDGARLENSLKQFKHALIEGRRPRSQGGDVYEMFLTDSRLLKKWWGLNAPVVFDFGEFGTWVIGKSLRNSAMVYQLPKDLLIRQFKRGNRPPPVRPLQRSN